MDEEDNRRFLQLFKNSGAKTMVEFIRASIFGRTLKVVSLDKHSWSYLQQLKYLKTQFRAVGNNYNQAVRALNSSLPEYKAEQKLNELILYTKQLISISQEIEALSEKVKDKILEPTKS